MFESESSCNAPKRFDLHIIIKKNCSRGHKPHSRIETIRNQFNSFIYCVFASRGRTGRSTTAWIPPSIFNNHLWFASTRWRFAANFNSIPIECWNKKGNTLNEKPTIKLEIVKTGIAYSSLFVRRVDFRLNLFFYSVLVPVRLVCFAMILWLARIYSPTRWAPMDTKCITTPNDANKMLITVILGTTKQTHSHNNAIGLFLFGRIRWQFAFIL